MFDDGWTLLRGYRNVRGEIDGLLLGSGGLVAIECNHVPYTVHCPVRRLVGVQVQPMGQRTQTGPVDRRRRSIA